MTPTHTHVHCNFFFAQIHLKNCKELSLLSAITPKINKLLLFILFTYCFSLPVFSQIPAMNSKVAGKLLSENEKQEKRDSIINNSDYIFKGYSYESPLMFIKDNNQVFIVFKVYISEVLRGDQDLKKQYIYIIKNTNSYKYLENETIEKFRKNEDYISPEYSLGVSSGFYFCKKNTIPLKYLTDSSYIDHNSIGFDVQNSFICEQTSNLVAGISIDDLNNQTYKGFYNKTFANQEEVINFLLPYGNITNPYNTTDAK
ncbi:MAG: hypothetical protein BWY22_01589 [Bacteroidetes bacterium ADurb.Bin217]|nr:MAG: hypothetical protein BWY22_01589 [Bacteroidetes bacterium ADurb.Bin217]